MVRANAKRLLLENVPRVGFYGDMLRAGYESCPEDMPLPSCLRAIMQYLEVPGLGCTHCIGSCDSTITE